MRCMNKFIDYQRSARKEILEWEEMEAQRRQEDQEHELRMLQLLVGLSPVGSHNSQSGGDEI